MGIRLLLLLFVIILVGMGILFYLLINELEGLQKDVKNLELLNEQLTDRVTEIVDFLMMRQKSKN